MTAADLPDSEYDRAGDFYYEFLQARLREPDFFFHQNVEVMVDMLGDVGDLQICDLACGEGFVARELAAHGARVTGIDLSENLLRHARRLSEGLDVQFVRDDAQTLGAVKDGSFDAVACHMALMDIPDYGATAKAVHRVLKLGGRFVFCVLHPCFETPFDAGHPPHEVDDQGNFVALRVTRYSEEGRWFSEGTGVRGTLGSIHRMLSTYLNELLTTGFTLSEIAEPTFDGEATDTFDKQVRRVVPRVLVISARKA